MKRQHPADNDVVPAVAPAKTEKQILHEYHNQKVAHMQATLSLHFMPEIISLIANYSREFIVIFVTSATRQTYVVSLSSTFADLLNRLGTNMIESYLTNGDFLKPSQTIEQSLVQEYSNIHHNVRMRGDIGTFVSEFAAQPFLQPKLASTPIVYMPHFLEAEICKRVIFSNNVQNEDDVKSILATEQITEMLGEAAMQQIISVFGEFNTIVLRHVIASDKIIPFHFDVALKTMQIVLNDDYQGGELMFKQQDESLFVPKRNVGSCTIHTNEHLHGVSKVNSGHRLSLFFLKY
jgi:hypothetical protein